MNNEIIHLYSGDSLATHPTNTSYDFTVDLRDSLEGEFKIALLELTANISEQLYVFCDIIEPSYCRNHTLPILRVVNISGECTNLHFYRASRRVIQRINVYIRNKDLQIPANEMGPVHCTLLLVPI